MSLAHIPNKDKDTYHRNQALSNADHRISRIS